MSRFCLDRTLLGTERHLVVDGDLVQWVSDVPPATWHLDGSIKATSDRCLDTVVKLAGIDLDVLPPKRFVQAMVPLTGSLGAASVPWQLVMPVREHQGFIKALVERVKVAMVQAPLDYYRAAWVPGNAVFRALQPAAVERPAWQALIDVAAGNIAAVRSFEPTHGFAQPVRYDRFRTLTGRLTVEQGPQILTLKREHRSIIRSSHGADGSVWALDFAALEARILLYEYGRKCDDPDLYGMIAKDIGHSRQAVKGAVICELYGSSKWALGKHLGIEGKQLNSFIKKVKIYFNTADLLGRVKKQFLATGRVINRYGRPVLIDDPLDHIFISYYGQSTGVDVTLLGFGQVIEQLAKRAPGVRPIFLLHDAMLLDVHNDDLAVLRTIDRVKVPGYVQNFPLRLEKVS